MLTVNKIVAVLPHQLPVVLHWVHRPYLVEYEARTVTPTHIVQMTRYLGNISFGQGSHAELFSLHPRFLGQRSFSFKI